MTLKFYLICLVLIQSFWPISSSSFYFVILFELVAA